MNEISYKITTLREEIFAEFNFTDESAKMGEFCGNFRQKFPYFNTLIRERKMKQKPKECSPSQSGIRSQKRVIFLLYQAYDISKK